MFHLKVFFQYFATDQAIADIHDEKEAVARKQLKDQQSRILTFFSEEDKESYIRGLEDSVKIEPESDETSEHYLQAIKDMDVYNRFQIIASEVTLNGEIIMYSPNITGGVGIMFYKINGRNYGIDTKKYTPRKHKEYLKMMEHDLNLKLVGKLEYFNHGAWIDSSMIGKA